MAVAAAVAVAVSGKMVARRSKKDFSSGDSGYNSRSNPVQNFVLKRLKSWALWERVEQ